MTAMLTPIDHGKARPSGTGRLWRKQLLPLGEIDYKGRKIKFDRAYLASLARSFTASAYDQVPFQLADSANTHTNDPERFRGDIRGVELTADGLDLILEPTEAGEKVLRDNPRLGVSARIVEAYQRADGKFFPAAIQHVLGTLDPRIPGMRPWQAVEAANEDDGDVWDLTVMDYATEDTEPAGVPALPVTEITPATPAPDTEDNHMALTTAQEARLAKLLDLPDEQFESLITPGTEDGGDEVTEDELTEAELQKLIDDIPDDVADLPAATPEPAVAALSSEHQAALDLANAQAAENALELANMRAELDRTRYAKERDELARLGIPARLVDLARPLLEGTGRTVELSNGTAVDAGAIVRKLLAEFGKTTQALGLSVELGNAQGADDEAAAQERAAQERADFRAVLRASQGLR